MAVGDLSYQSSITSGVDNTRCIMYTSDGAFMYVTEYDDDAIVCYSLSSGVPTYQSQYSNVNIDGAQWCCMDSTESYVFVSSMGNDAISYFTRNATTGALTYVGSIVNGTDVSNMADPYWIGITKDNSFLYVCASGSNAVHWMSISSGVPTPVSYLQSTTYCYATRGACFSPDSSDLFFHCTSRSGDRISWFNRNVTTGEITVIASWNNSTFLDKPIGVTISDDGEYCYVCADINSTGGGVFCLSRNTSTGGLTPLSYNDDTELAGSLWLKLSLDTDNPFVYVACESGTRVTWLSRNSSTGATTTVNYITDVGGNMVNITSDNKYLHLSCGGGNAVSLYNIEQAPSGGGGLNLMHGLLGGKLNKRLIA